MSIISAVNTPDWERETLGNIVLVHFFAPWCSACSVQEKNLVTIIDEVDVNFLKLNIDDNRWLSQNLGVRNIPCVVLYNNSKEIFRLDGVHSKGSLLDCINKLKL